jgi:hypothetical protein
MRLLALTLLALMPAANVVTAQGLSASEQKIVDSARSRYYSLDLNGFLSYKCTVKFDFSTVPILPSDNPSENLALLKSTQFAITEDRDGPTVSHTYPSGTSETAKRRADPMTNLLTSLVKGLFLTWPTKGLHGPIPSFNSQIKSVAETSNGFEFILSFPGDPVRIDLDRNYLATEIVSVGGKVDERPKYSPSPDGLIFIGNHAIDNEDSGEVELEYDLESSTIDGLRLPTSAHLVIHPNIDVRFALDECSVNKGTVLTVLPPKTAATPKH